MSTAKMVKNVLKLNTDGVSQTEIAEKCGDSVQTVESIIEASGNDKVCISEDTMSLWTIANEIDCESDNIYGIANLLFCAGNSVGELTAEALYALGNNLFDICEKLKKFSEGISKLRNDKA